ncbi:hypothetical protein [Erythrobacter sp. QSSC1-22B]|uniref:hypothetical protein n=1 Tax=Erythrobacter sp. QSSC1-22B TaxID=1860125 RepID=UPI0011A8D07D|nr:hypothetical protein [Erythrobacter sp. QSSC1-22B]
MLGIAQSIAILAMAQAAQAPATDNYGYEALVEGRETAAIATIMDNDQIANDDPARLINLGIAYARKGDAALARQLFEAARDNRDRVELETAEGEWIDSRRLARQALAMLERGEFSEGARIAAR